MHKIIENLIVILESTEAITSDIITWGAPIPAFGSFRNATVATLGLNPSDKEFLDNSGQEISGGQRRFHTLTSLQLPNWDQISETEVKLIEDSCNEYFFRNPYNKWFRPLDHIISGTSASYYNRLFSAVHLDLIPFATHSKWTNLTNTQKNTLLKISSSTLEKILQNSPIKTIVLNGSTVIKNFLKISNVDFIIEHIPEWDLPRNNTKAIRGISYKGIVTEIAGITLTKPVLALGFNHNIQSSFGVTLKARNSIRDWISKQTSEATK